MSNYVTELEASNAIREIVRSHRFGIKGSKLIEMLELCGVPVDTSLRLIYHAVFHGDIAISEDLWLEIPEEENDNE